MVARNRIFCVPLGPRAADVGRHMIRSDTTRAGLLSVGPSRVWQPAVSWEGLQLSKRGPCSRHEDSKDCSAAHRAGDGQQQKDCGRYRFVTSSSVVSLLLLPFPFARRLTKQTTRSSGEKLQPAGGDSALRERVNGVSLRTTSSRCRRWNVSRAPCSEPQARGVGRACLLEFRALTGWVTPFLSLLNNDSHACYFPPTNKQVLFSSWEHCNIDFRPQ